MFLVTRNNREIVLIETYWNVKGNAIFVQDFLQLVLIETYWNVKKVW